jgi:hypothetical protein
MVLQTGLVITSSYLNLLHSKIFGYFSGASEMLMAKAVSHLASKTPGKESIAIESFANALRQVRYS